MQQLVVVRRDKFATFGLLAQAFAEEPNVRLVWDRRVRDRRRAAGSDHPTDRRRGDRRRNASAMWGSTDYLLITVAERAPDAAPAGPDALASSVTPSDRSEEFQSDIEAAVRTDLTVLISGGDADSRNSLAHQIHQRSNRRESPFLVIDRNTLLATTETFAIGSDAAYRKWMNAGTVLIEEVADLDWEQQSQLLLVLERRALEPSRGNGLSAARIVAATAHRLLDRIAARRFKADLFYRLNLIHLELPSGPMPTLK